MHQWLSRVERWLWLRRSGVRPPSRQASLLLKIIFLQAPVLQSHDKSNVTRACRCLTRLVGNTYKLRIFILKPQNFEKIGKFEKLKKKICHFFLQLSNFYQFSKNMVFTDRCRDPNSERGMPTVMCGSVCVSLMEPDVEAGVFIGFKHIRGCLDRVLRHGFNQSALRTHRFHQNNHCRTLSRSALFNPARQTDPPALGDVQLCSCYGDRFSTSVIVLKKIF
nr:hypothetical protein Y39B6B.dd [imported] - Caenorhabditis elegans [Caenorhabditis elegans]